MNILESLTRNEPDSMHQELPIIWDRAQGTTIWDDKGKEYLDFCSGIFVANVGHAHPKVVEAIEKQIHKPLLHAYTFPTKIRAELVEKLLSYAPWLDSVVLLSTGSETTDAALRAINYYHLGGKVGVVSFTGAYHGNTIGARMLNNGTFENPCRSHEVIERRVNIGYMPRAVVSTDFDIDFKKYSEDIAGAIIVPFIGWSCQWYSHTRLHHFCQQVQSRGGLIAFDVMQSGFGRTGEFWGFERYDVKPDIICCGKAMGGGLPISAIISRKEILNLDDDIFTTHSANPVCCAAALATLQVIEEEGLVLRAKRLGHIIENFMRDNGLKAEGKGLIWAIHVDSAEQADKIVNQCAEKGLMMIKTRKPSIKVAPPLVITEVDLKRGLEVIKKCVLDTLV